MPVDVVVGVGARTGPFGAVLRNQWRAAEPFFSAPEALARFLE
jgi:hypothetical protein